LHACYIQCVSCNALYALKAAHEAKVHTSWISPNEPYEQATREFIDGILAASPRNLFLADFEPFARAIAELGIWNSLSQTLLKLTSPGVPDLYQGTELFDFRLVDPDNRGPVDFAHRRELLDALEHTGDETAGAPGVLARELLAGRSDGRIKLHVIRQLLNYRREHPELFTSGQYLPVELSGSRREHVCAFCRKSGDTVIIVAAPRLVAGLVAMTSRAPLGPETWEDTRLILPKGMARGQFVNLFTGEMLPADGESESPALLVASALMTFPVAALAFASSDH
jgi:(1->4)-alpha-D-glucan 1-alpha-D-glucosylmutase